MKWEEEKVTIPSVLLTQIEQVEHVCESEVTLNMACQSK